MKSFKLLAGVPVLFGVLSGAAQTSPDTQQARANVLQSRYMTSVKVELTTKLDTKNAVAGQPLMAKTLADVSLADGTAIPAGTRLLGSVVEVRGMSGDRTGAIVTVTFDRAELKGAKTLEVRSMIRAISSPGGARAPAVDAARRTPDPIMGADESGLGGAGMGGAGIGGAGYPGGGVGGAGVGGPGYPEAGMLGESVQVATAGHGEDRHRYRRRFHLQSRGHRRCGRPRRAGSR